MKKPGQSEIQEIEVTKLDDQLVMGVWVSEKEAPSTSSRSRLGH